MKRTFRLGTTSYIYPDDMLPNVRRLASRVDDIELVLFEVDDYGTNLPDPATIAELKTLATDHALSYTVHLPIDLDWRDARSFEKIFRALDATRTLDPFAYILHLDGRMLIGEPSSAAIAQWQSETMRALDRVVAHIDPSRLCIENLERWAPEFFTAIVAQKNLARCVDVGHLWKQARDPLPHLRAHIAQTRVIHLHGINGRDHQSLAWQARDEVTRVLDFLARAEFAGVLTLEVFNVDDFISSHQVVAEWENDLH
jgi:sugar phosphate isomerase/epimerase